MLTENQESTSVFPLVHATILRFVSVKPVSKPEAFKQDAMVRLKPSSKFFIKDAAWCNSVGRIMYVGGPNDNVGPDDRRADKTGWVFVEFVGFKNWFRVGFPNIENGACDLEFDGAQDEKFAVIASGGQIFELPVSGFDAEPGDTVKLAQQRIVGVERAIPAGAIAFVARKFGGQFAEVDVQGGGRRTVSTGKFKANDIEESGRVVLDSSLNVIIENLGLEDGTFSVTETEMVEWSDVIGQNVARDQIKEALEGRATRAELYDFFKKKTSSGFLLYGPPGCGKTYIGKAAYSSYAAACKAKGIPLSAGFILVSGPELLSKYVGVAEAAVRYIFAKARKFYEKYGIPALIFIDECESIAANRDSGISSDVLKTIVPALLAEMNGVRKSGAIVMMATNKPESLDPAIVREGRLDIKIEIIRPTRESAAAILRNNFKNVPISTSTNLEKIVQVGVEELFSSKQVIYTITRTDTSVTNFTLAQIVSAAMISLGVVEKAKALALEREKAKAKGTPLEGVREEDVINAVAATRVQNLDLDHGQALGDFTKSFQNQIAAIEKQRMVQK